MQYYLLLTEKCNLKCPMCIRGKQNGNSVDFEKLKATSFTEDISKDVVILTGGEPTLHPQFSEIVRFFCQKCKKVVITTNGTTGFDLKKFSNIRNLHIQVSIDGDSESHDMIRGDGTYNKSFACLEEIDDAKMTYSVATVVNRENMNSLPKLISNISKLANLAYWKVSYEMPFENHSYKKMLSAEEWNHLVDNLIMITPFKIKIQKIFPIALYEEHFEDLLKNINSRCHNCGGGTNKIYIYPDFTVYPCTCLTDFPIGNLLSENMKEILSGEKINQFKHYVIQSKAKCSTCKYKPLCNGGCVGMSYHYFGKLGMGDIRCPLM